MPPPFIKFHGFGNDYIVIEGQHLRDVADIGNFARAICNRHLGAGSDGIAIVSPLSKEVADFNVRIFNPDGSEANLSGNGTRCAAAYLYYQKSWNGEQLRLDTRAGVKHYVLREQAEGKYIFDSELGKPRFDSESVPIRTERPIDRVINYPLAVGDETFNITALEMGNPNCCIFVKDFEEIQWRRIGSMIETHEQFPERTNVTFIRVLDPKRIELRIWERGVGETTASGTCSCAAAVAAMINDRTERKITALMPGGEAQIYWRDDDEVIITGSAELVYSGDWLARPRAGPK